MIWVVKQHLSFELFTMLYSIYFSNCHNTPMGGRHCAIVQYNCQSDSQGMQLSEACLQHGQAQDTDGPSERAPVQLLKWPAPPITFPTDNN